MNIIKKIRDKFSDKKLHAKIDSLEKEIELVRELTTENYWKLKKEFGKKPRNPRKKA
jgi:hypothetical protein